MHPWTAELVTRNTHTDLTAQHERALAMRLRRFAQQRGSYDDLLDIPRHLAALRRYDDIPGIAAQAAQILPGTLATVAYLAEIRPLIPPAERAWILVADLEVQALLSAGDLTQPPGSCKPSTSTSKPAPPPTPPTRSGSATCRSATTARGRRGRGRGPGRRPRRLPGQARHPRAAGRR